MTQNPFCTQSHKLQWTDDRTIDYFGNKYRCDLCGSVYFCDSKRWWCKICSYDLCPSCRPYKPPSPSPSPPLSSSLSKTCDNGHELAWRTEDYDLSPGYICNGCTARLPCRSGRWQCPLCKYDLCPYCSTNLVCKNNHTLIWYSKEREDYDYAPEYECNGCNSINESKLGRWHCSDCFYNLCVNCIHKISQTEAHDTQSNSELNINEPIFSENNDQPKNNENDIKSETKEANKNNENMLRSEERREGKE